MKRRKTIVAIVIFAVITAMGWPSVSTAGPAIAGIPEVLNRLNLLIKQVDGLQLACTTPDLVPIPLPGFPATDLAGFCRMDGEGKLHVLVHNQGGGTAGASTTSVLFRSSSGLGGALCGPGCFEVDLPTPALGGFASADLIVPALPTDCFDIDLTCLFKIAVDSASVVSESNEANNNVAGQCVEVIE